MSRPRRCLGPIVAGALIALGALLLPRGVYAQSAVFQAPRVDRSVYGNHLLLRPQDGTSSILLVRASKGPGVLRVDVQAQTSQAVPLQAWDRASGPIADELQVDPAPVPWSFDAAQGSLTFKGQAAALPAPHALAMTCSPRGDYLAVVAAGGRFRPRQTGLMLGGGRDASASGPHQLQLLTALTGQPVGQPRPLPFSTSEDGALDVLWSADRRFVVVLAQRQTERLCVYATSLPPLSTTPPAQPGLTFHRLERRTHLVDMSFRRLSDSDPAGGFLLKFAGVVYAYDPVAATLQELPAARWDQAGGAARDLLARRAGGSLTSHYSSAGCQLQFGERPLPARGSFAWGTAAPDSSHAAVVSVDSRDGSGDTYFIELFDLAALRRVAGPFSVSQQVGPTWCPDGEGVVFSSYDGSAYYYLAVPGEGSAQPKCVPFQAPTWGMSGGRLPVLEFARDSVGRLLVRRPAWQVVRVSEQADEVVDVSGEEWTAARELGRGRRWPNSGLLAFKDGALSRRDTGKGLPTAGRRALGLWMGPAGRRALVFSADPTQRFFEVRELPSTDLQGKAKAFPWKLRDFGRVLWTPDDAYAFALHQDGRELAIFATEGAPADGAQPAAGTDGR